MAADIVGKAARWFSDASLGDATQPCDHWCITFTELPVSDQPRLDAIDWKILDLLQQDARITNVDLARQVNLSPSPCLARVRALEKSGYIARYVSLLDPLKLGLQVSVFIQVRLERQIESALERFERAMRDRPEVMECYLMTGDADYLLRVLVTDIQALQDFIVNVLSRVPGVGNIQSSFALKQVKYQTAVPLPSGTTGGRAG